MRTLQQPLFTPETEWVPPDRLPDLSSHAEIAIDLETRDPNLTTMGSGSVRGDGEIVGIAVAVEGWSGYFPIAHEGGGNMDRGLVLDWFEELLNNTATKIFHNAMYDVSWIRSLGFHINGGIIDTMIAASLCDENRYSYTLDSVGKDYINMRKNEKLLQEAAKDFGVNPKAEMWRLPATFVGEYAEKDAEITLKLWHALQHEISKQDLWDIFNLETNLFPCLVDMKFRGVRVDLEAADKVKKELVKREKELSRQIKKIAGFDVELWAGASIAKAFDTLKIPYDRTELGAPSFTKNFLATHPADLPKLIVQAREFNKANTTFIDTILKHSHKGRIHAEINQIRSDQGGTVTGRFSYNNPNLQQIPARHKVLGPMIRSLFIPEEKHTWGCFDYSQQEPRILVHFAILSEIRGSEILKAAYQTGDADFHQVVADIAKITRKQAKRINLGIMYGMGKNKLMGELGLTKLEAERIWKDYHEMFPVLKQLQKKVETRANQSGAIRTIGGRKLHFPYWEPHGFNVAKPIKGKEEAEAEYGPGMVKRSFLYRGLNKLIQGSAADQTKQAMIALYREGVIPHVQVHDELDISISSVEEAQRVVRIMEEAVRLEVPNKVDYEKGENWGSIK